MNKYADDDYIRAQLRRIKFFSSKFRFSPEILADDTNQMALIFNPITLRFSICYDEMKYEVVIPYHQLLGCTIKDEKTMEIRFKRECMKIVSFSFFYSSYIYIYSKKILSYYYFLVFFSSRRFSLCIFTCKIR